MLFTVRPDRCKALVFLVSLGLFFVGRPFPPIRVSRACYHISPVLFLTGFIYGKRNAKRLEIRV